MKKLVSFMLSLALVGMIGLTAGCNKKKEITTHETPKVEKHASSVEKKAAEKKPEKEKSTKEESAEKAH